MRCLRRIFLLAAFSLGAIPAARAQPVVIRLSNAVGDRADVSSRVAQLFQKEAEDAAGGRLKVQLFYGNQLGTLPAILDQVKDGTIQMNITGLPFLARYVPDVQAFGLPFLFASAEAAHRAFDGPLGREVRQVVAAQAGIRILAIGEYGFVSILTTRHPIRAIADLKGLRIRTTPSPTAMATFTILGAIPVTVDYAEIYTALQRGALDGTDQALPIMESGKFYEVGKYITETNHFFNAMVFDVNAKFFDGLAPDLQKILEDAALKAQDFDRTTMVAENRRVHDDLAAKGVQFVVPDAATLDAFRAAVAPIYADAKTRGSFGVAGTRWMDTLRAAP